MRSGTATYVYCVVRSRKKPPTSRVPPGLPGASRPAPVRLAPSLWLIVADVPLRTYGPRVLERGLRDIPWVADTAVAHEGVVEHFTRVRGAVVVPMKLFTLFSSVERSMAEISRKLDAIEAVVQRIAGCEEWGVRVVRSSLPQPPARRGAGKSGVAFLMAKKHARDETTRRAKAAADAAEEAFEELEVLTRGTWRRATVPEGATAPPLLDAAFLVPVKQRARFQAAAKRLAGHCSKAGAEMTLSGPWPAYSFTQGEGRS